MRKLLSIILSMALILSCIGTVSFADEATSSSGDPYVIAGLEDYIVTSGVFTGDEISGFIEERLTAYIADEDPAKYGDLGIPVGYTTYVNPNAELDTVAENIKYAPLIFYVVNTNTARVGKATDAEIVSDLLNRGYVVVVLDYYNNAKAVYPALDWNIQAIRREIAGANIDYYGDADLRDEQRREYTQQYINKEGEATNIASSVYHYVLPAGYTLDRQINYWSIDKHGHEGVIEFIISSWNSDFLSVVGGIKDSAGETTEDITFAEETKIIASKDAWSLEDTDPNKYITFAAGTTISVVDYTARLGGGVVTDITQCINRDGTPISMDLYMDIVYPANPANEVPVMMYMGSSLNTVGTWASADRPHLTGFLLRGYAGVLVDYPFVPMSRADHYADFAGDYATTENRGGGVTGDNYTYSIGAASGIKVDTAAVRTVRYLASESNGKYKFAEDKYGAIGISKSGYGLRLGHDDPESLPETKIYEGQSGETRYEAGVTAEDTITDAMGRTVVRAPEEQPNLYYKDGTKIPANVQFTSMAVGSGWYSVMEGYKTPMYIYGTVENDGSQFNFYPNLLSRCYTHNVPTMYYEGIDLGRSSGHTLCYGPDAETGNGTYEPLFTTADYTLRDMGAKCEYIKPLNGAMNVKATQEIIVKFGGSVPEAEISKITIKDVETGEEVDGLWKPSFGDTEWTFTPYKLVGGQTYIVTVPSTIVGTNGKNILEAKTSSFTVEPEELAEATTVGDNKTATNTEGVYFEVEDADIKTSTSTSIRFGVKNDAANVVYVYAADATTQEPVGEPLGEINLVGAGEYDLDVTEYVDALAEGEKAAFVLMAKKAAEEKVLTNKKDFTATSLGLAVGPPEYVTREASSDIPDATGATGNTSYKISAVTPRSYTNSATGETSHAWYSVMDNPVGHWYGASGKEFTEADYGRKFKAEIKIYDTTSRVVQFLVGEYGSGSLGSTFDSKAVMPTYRTVEAGWTTCTFEWRAVGNLYTKRRYIQIRPQTFGTDSINMPMYIDDLVATEIITNVDIASGTDGYIAPSLVLHPGVANSVDAKSGYVENGEYADTSFEGEENLLVSGRTVTLDSIAKKLVYAKIDLSSFVPNYPAKVKFNVAGDATGTISVYGLEEEVDMDNLTYENAPGNEPLEAGVNLDEVYNGEAIGTIEVSGAGEYSVDITDYALYAQDMGLDGAYLLFAADTQDVEISFEFAESNDSGYSYEKSDFTDSEIKYNAGTANKEWQDDLQPEGVAVGYEAIGWPATGRNINPVTTEDHTGDEGGTSVHLKSLYTYNRIFFYNVLDGTEPTEEGGKNTLTEADIGRTYRISMWIKADKTGYFYLSMAKGSDGSLGVTLKQQKFEVTTANVWTEYVYEVEVDETMLPTTTTDETTGETTTTAGRGVLMFYPSGFGQASDGSIEVNFYFDDLKVVETTAPKTSEETPYLYTNSDFESSEVGGTWFDTSVGPTWQDMLIPDNDRAVGHANADNSSTNPSVLEVTSDTANTLGGSGTSVHLLSERNITCLYFYNVIDELVVGKTYRMSMWIKADKEGTFRLTMTKRSAYNAGKADLHEQTYTVSADDVGKWKKYTYEVTVDDTMVTDGKGTLMFVPYSFGQVQGDATKAVNFYIDNICSYEVASDGTEIMCSAEAAKTVSSQTLDSDALVVYNGTTEVVEGVKKAYLSFDGSAYEDVKRATLNINVSEQNGQTIKVYGIIDPTYPTSLTYNTAPATNADESMDLTAVYGGAALAEITLTEAGTYSINISDYVMNNETDGKYLFAITSEGKNEDAVVIAKTSNLVLETAPEVDVPVVDTGLVEINVTTLGGNSVSINGTNKGTSTTEEIDRGSDLGLSAAGDGEFLYWIDTNANTILSYTESYTLTAGSDRNIAAVYADKTEAFVTFTSLGNKLLGFGIASTIEVPADPYVYGYTFNGWYAGGTNANLIAGGAVDIAENTEFKAGFVKNSETYTVTVNGVAETYTYNDKVTVTADAEKDGAAFSYWERDDEIVSYNAEYSFYVNGSTTVKAVYGKNATAGAVLVMAAPTLVDGTKIAFFAERDIPTGCTLIETGILIGTSADLDIDNAQYKATAASTANKGQYTVRKANVAQGQTWYGVAYAIYRDTSGTIVTAYSNEVSYEVK